MFYSAPAGGREFASIVEFPFRYAYAVVARLPPTAAARRHDERGAGGGRSGKMAAGKSGKRAVKPIDTAVIGLGRAGWNIHVRGLRKRPEYNITAVAEKLEARREEARAEFGCEAFKDLPSLLKGCSRKPELMIVATRTQEHCADGITALKAGAHVLLEKPCGVNAAEVRRLIAAAKKAKRRFFPHHNYRFRRDIQYLMQHVRKSPIGPVFEIRVNILGYARRVDWQVLRRFGGGLLGNHGTHYIDAVMQMLGTPVKTVLCDMKHICDAGDCEDHCKVILRAASGRLAEVTLSTSVAQPLPPWTLYGKYGALTVNGKAAKLKYYDPKKVARLKVNLGAPAGRKYGTDEVLPWVEREEEAVGPDIGNIYDDIFAVLRRGRKQPYITPESVLETVKVLDACRKQNPRFA